MKAPLMKYILIPSVILALVALAGWRISSLKLSKRITELTHAYATIDNLNASIEANEKLTQAVADADAATIRGLNEELAKIKRMRTADTVVRIKADCPTVPEATTAPSVDYGRGARLTAEAREHYFQLLEEIELVQAKLHATQAYIRTACAANNFR